MRVLFIIILIVSSIITYSQTDGYKDVKLGEKFDFVELLKSYKIKQITQRGFHLVSNVEQKFCNIPIAYIDIKLNEDTTINLIQVYTNEIIYKGWEDFVEDYKAVALCIVNTVGTASYYDPGTDREDGVITTGWAFDDQKKLLALYGTDLKVSENNVPRHFLIAWIQSNGETKMW